MQINYTVNYHLINEFKVCFKEYRICSTYPVVTQSNVFAVLYCTRSDHYSSFGSYLDDKRKKLRVQYTAQYGVNTNTTNQQIITNHVLHGCVFWFNGFISDIESVKHTIYIHGGLVENVLVSGVTHIIASQLPNTKVKQLKHSTTPVVVLKYIYDCIDAGYILDTADYITPELRDNQQSVVGHYFNKNVIATQSTDTTKSTVSLSKYIPRKMASPSVHNYNTITQFGEHATGTAAVLSSNTVSQLSQGRTGMRIPVRTKQIPAVNDTIQYVQNSGVSQMHKPLINHTDKYIDNNDKRSGKYSQLHTNTGVPQQSITHLYHQIDQSVNDIQYQQVDADIKPDAIDNHSIDDTRISEQNAAVPDPSDDVEPLMDTHEIDGNDTDQYDGELELALAAMQTQQSININKHNDTVINDNMLLQSPTKPTTTDIINQSIHSTPSTSSHPLSNRISPVASNLTYVPPKYTLNTNTARSTLNDPNFVFNYFASSRLHFIGSFKEHLNTIYPQLLSIQPLYPSYQARVPTLNHNSKIVLGDTTSKQRIVLHIDMDCFFVSASIRDQPELSSKPVAVAHSTATANSTSEISSCNYVAREYGLCAGMSIGRASELCQDLIVLDYNFELYARLSEQIYRVFFSYTHCVQSVSCDEAYLELPPWVNALIIAQQIKSAIYTSTQCNASIGIGSSKLLSRLATKQAKPNNIFQLHYNELPTYVDPLNVAELPGVGWSIQRKLKLEFNVELCRELQQISKAQLQHEFGSKTGDMLYNTCRGNDTRALETNKLRKSLGADVNYGVRFNEYKQIQKFITDIASEVVSRLRNAHVRGYCITVNAKKRGIDAPVEPAKFLGHGVCDNYSKTINVRVSIDGSADSVTILAQHCIQLYNTFNIEPTWLRGFGIHISKIESDSVIYNEYGIKVHGRSRGSKQGRNLSLMFTKQSAEINKANDNNVIKHGSRAQQPSKLETTSPAPIIQLSQLDDNELAKLAEQLSQQRNTDSTGTYTNHDIRIEDSSSNNQISTIESSPNIGNVVNKFNLQSTQLMSHIQSLIVQQLANIGSHEQSNAVAAMSLQQLLNLQLSSLHNSNSSNVQQPVVIIVPADSDTFSSKPLTSTFNLNATTTDATSDLIPVPSNVVDSGGITIDQLPALSELDRATVVELPVDIRKELADAYKKRRALAVQQSCITGNTINITSIPSAVPETVPPINNQQSSTSNSTTNPIQPNNQSKSPHRSANSAVSLNDLPEYSELDADVLASLPQDIRNELQRVYNQRKRNQLFDKQEQRQSTADKRIKTSTNTNAQIVHIQTKSKRSNVSSHKPVKVQSIAAHFTKLHNNCIHTDTGTAINNIPVVPVNKPRVSLKQKLSEQAQIDEAIRISMLAVQSSSTNTNTDQIIDPSSTSSNSKQTDSNGTDINMPKIFTFRKLDPISAISYRRAIRSPQPANNTLTDDIIELSDTSSVDELNMVVTDTTVHCDELSDDDSNNDYTQSTFQFDSDVQKLSTTLIKWLDTIDIDQVQQSFTILQDYCTQQIELYRNLPAVNTLITVINRYASNTNSQIWHSTHNILLSHVQSILSKHYSHTLSIQPIKSNLFS